MTGSRIGHGIHRRKEMKQVPRISKANIGGRAKKDYKLWIYLFPCLLFVAAFSYVPIAGWILAFMDYIPGVPLTDVPMAGLKNFMLIFDDLANLTRVMKNTVVFAALGYVAAPLPMIFAIALNEVANTKLKRTIQTITTFPNFISWVIVYALAFQFFSYDGLLSNLLTSIGIAEEPTSLIANAGAVYVFQTVMGLWKGLGWNAVIYLAAIAGIDQERYEAADIDGAGRLQKIWYITVPSVMPTFIVLMLLQISSFVGNGFEQYLTFYNGIVADKIEVLDLYVYRAGLLRSDYSYGTAIGIMKSVISIGMLFGMNRLSKKIRGDSIF